MTRKPVVNLLDRADRDEWNAVQGHTFDGQLHYAGIDAEAEAELRALARTISDGNIGPDSEDDFVLRLLDYIDWTREEIRAARADKAARLALNLGRLISEFQLKMRHEPTLLKYFEGLRKFRDAGEAVNAGRQKAHQHEWGRWQACADAIWEQSPTLSKSRVASRVKAKLDLKGVAERTIRDRLTKPGEPR